MRLRPVYYLTLAALLLPGHAWADHNTDSTNASAKARVLFAQARALVDDGMYREACDLFEESRGLVDGVGTQFNLASCWAKLGKTASAWRLFLDVEERAAAAGQTERAEIAQQRADVLESRLTKLSLDVSKEVPGLRVWRGERRVRRALWGVAIPIDPGVYTVRATAEGFDSFEIEVRAPREGRSAEVVIPPLTRIESSFERPAVANPDWSSSPKKHQPSQAAGSANMENDWDWQTWGVLGSLTTGAVGLVIGTISAFRASDASRRADQVCQNDELGCRQVELNQADLLYATAIERQRVAQISFGVGILGAAGALLCWTWPQSNSSSETLVEAKVELLPDGVGTSLVGSF